MKKLAALLQTIGDIDEILRKILLFRVSMPKHALGVK